MLLVIKRSSTQLLTIRRMLILMNGVRKPVTDSSFLSGGQLSPLPYELVGKEEKETPTDSGNTIKIRQKGRTDRGSQSGRLPHHFSSHRRRSCELIRRRLANLYPLL